jgi:hypothetical protein
MIDNIFAHWQSQRFIIADEDIVENNEHIAVLTDVEYWVENYDTLVDWCRINGGEVTSMVVEFPNESTMALFCLRWA